MPFICFHFTAGTAAGDDEIREQFTKALFDRIRTDHLAQRHRFALLQQRIDLCLQALAVKRSFLQQCRHRAICHTLDEVLIPQARALGQDEHTPIHWQYDRRNHAVHFRKRPSRHRIKLRKL